MQFDIDGREVFASDCEWTLDDAASRVSALYTYDDEDTVLSLWLVDSALTEFDPLRDEVEAAVSVFAATIEPPQEGDFEAVLLKHVIGFGAVVCSEGSVPISADLMNRAAASGNAFTFMMAGAATDYTEFMVLREVTGRLRAALLLPLLTVPQVVAIGWALNMLG